MFTIPNAVLVAVMQVGVVVVGCLGAATSWQLTVPYGAAVRLPTLLLKDYWFCFMVLPLIWITTALQIRRIPAVSAEAKGTIFWFGVFLVGALLVLGVCGFFGQLMLELNSAGGDRE